MATLQETKEFLRLDPSETREDVFLSSLLIASDSYIVNSTSINVDKTNELYKTAQLFLVAHWFENRNTVLIGTVSKNLEYSLQSILDQLKYTAIDLDETGTTQDIRLFDELNKKQDLIVQGTEYPTNPKDLQLFINDTANTLERYKAELNKWLVIGGGSVATSIDVKDSTINGNITVTKDGADSEIKAFDDTELKAGLDNKANIDHNHDGVYAPVSHTHPISEVENLQSTLDQKASADHNHNGVYAPVTHTHKTSEVEGLDNTLNGKLNKPATANTNDVLSFDGTNWTAKAPSGGGVKRVTAFYDGFISAANYVDVKINYPAGVPFNYQNIDYKYNIHDTGVTPTANLNADSQIKVEFLNTTTSITIRVKNNKATNLSVRIYFHMYYE